MQTARDILRNTRRQTLLRERPAGETFRSVFRLDDAYVAKKFAIPLSARAARRPWLAEDAGLRRLDGDGAPRSFGWFEEREADRRVVWLVKEYVPGVPLETFSQADLPAVAALMARIHRMRIITDDASAGNFIRAADGNMRFLDFGRARLYRRAGLRLGFGIGWELAKLRREGFRWDPILWRAFLPPYFQALACPGALRALILASCRFSIALRMARKFFQGKSPRS